jgi:hypothetical protein
MAFVDTKTEHVAKCNECEPAWESVTTTDRRAARRWAKAHDESVHGVFV